MADEALGPRLPWLPPHQKPNKSVQATAAARFRFLAFVFFIHGSCRPHPFPAAVPDLRRWAATASRA